MVYTIEDDNSLRIVRLTNNNTMEYTMNYTVLTLEEWEDKYEPVQDIEGVEIFYETYISDGYVRDYQALLDEATRLAGGSELKAHHHIWTRQDGEDGNLVLTNGIHFVNRLDYCLTKKPWATKENDKSKDIVVKYSDM